MNVYLFGFQKKRNSTKQPLLADGTLFSNVQLKEETSVLNPVLLFNPSSAGMPNPFNPNFFTYAFVQKFDRFYFITDWRWLNGIWECSLVVDVLASYKNAIGNMSEYVVRSASAYNGYIADKAYPTHTNLTITPSNCLLNFNLTGFYALGVISNDSAAATGAITYYFLTAQQIATLKAYLMSENFLVDNQLNNLTDINKEMIKVLYNPYQYIVSCKFFPLPFPSVGTDETIKFGWWTMNNITGRKMTSAGYVAQLVSDDIATPAHPQAGSRGSYLNHAPFTERYIVHPLLGTILLDSNKIDAGDTVSISFMVDAVTGEATVTILNSTKNIELYQNVLQLAVDIPLAQMNTDVIGVARTAISATGNVLSNALSLNVGGTIAAGANGILDTLQASVPILQSNGLVGNRSMFNLPAKVINAFRLLVNEDQANLGRPLCEVRTINTLSGYIQCADAHVDLSCYASEKEDILSYMENGFYYE